MTRPRDSLTEEQLLDFRNAFDVFDTNHVGMISSEQLRNVMVRLGQKPTDDEISKMIKKVDKNGNDVIEFDEFLDMMCSYISHHEQEENITKDIFMLFDRNKNGVISTKELRSMMKSLGEKLTGKQVSQMMKFADINKDGGIDFEEFKRLMEEVPHVKSQCRRAVSNP